MRVLLIAAALLLPHGDSAPLTVAVVLQTGFVERTILPDGKPLFSGMAIEVFEAALDTICKSSALPCWDMTEDGSSYILNSTVEDVITSVEKGLADVGVGDVNEILSRTQRVNFTGAWLDAPLAFLASPLAPTIVSNLWGWLRPFTTEVWLCLLAMTALFAVSLAWLERWSPFSFRNLPPPRGREELRQRVNMKDTWHRAVNSLLGQGPWGIELSSHSARLIWWAMAFMSLFTTTFYTSSLTSQLVAQPASTAINSITDIQSERIPFCVIAGSSAYAFIKNTRNTIAIQRMAAYMVTAPTLKDCLDKLLDAADPVRVVMAEAPLLSVLSSSPPYCGPVVVGTLLAQGYYSFPVRVGHPILSPLSDAILGNMESLVTSDIVTTYLAAGGCSGGGGGGGGGSSSAIGIADLGGVFFATLIIVTLSWVLLGCEVAVWRRREREGWCSRAVFKFCGGHYFVDAYDREDEDAEASYVEDAPRARGARKGVEAGAGGWGAAFSAANPLNW